MDFQTREKVGASRSMPAREAGSSDDRSSYVQQIIAEHVEAGHMTSGRGDPARSGPLALLVRIGLVMQHRRSASEALL